MNYQIGLKAPIIVSLLASAAIPGLLFFKTADLYFPIYIFLIITHFFYTLSILTITRLKVPNILVNALLILGLLSLTEIVLSLFSIPLSYTVFLYDYSGFSLLLPYVGSELAFAILIAFYTLIGRHSPVLAVALFTLIGLAPPPSTIDEKPPGASLRVAIVQTVLPQRITSYPGISDGLGYWKTRLIEALQKANAQNVDIIMLPESAMPGFHPQQTPVIKEILGATQGTSLIAHRYVDIVAGKGISSQAGYWSPDGPLEDIHEKQSPLPIAEKFIVPGENANFDHQGILISPFICSESLDVYQIRRRLSYTDIGMVLANEAEIKHTYLPELHLISERIRARESGIPILRASNFRLSAYIDSKGEVELESSDSRWENLYATVSLSDHSFFSRTYIFQHVFILIGTLFLFSSNKKIINFTHSKTIYILIITCIIRINFSYGYEKNSSDPPEMLSELYLDDLFPVRQLGVTDEFDMEQVTPYIDLTHIHIKDVPFTRGVGIVHTVRGTLYIMERSGDQYTTLSGNGFSKISKERLEEISLSDVLWYAYEI